MGLTKDIWRLEDRQAKVFHLRQSSLTMELYDDLASNNEEVRIKAAEALVNRILQGERAGNPEKGTDLLYALNRLVKGLSSGRESARLGFSIALTEVSLLIARLT